MIVILFLFVSSISVSAQLYLNNDIMFDYPEELPMHYVPVFENYPDVIPDYRVFYPPPSYSTQMWNGCGCDSAKTYGDYMKVKPRSKPSRNQRLYSYYTMM